MEQGERTWGPTPVPDRLRTLSLADVGLLWGNLGVSLLVLFTGTFLAGLGLQRALLATVVGAALGTALLGLAGLIGFERRVPGMVLLRDPLGRRGSYAPTALNVVQNLGWAVFELYVMSLAASALADELFGFDERWVWVLAFGALTAWLALAGPSPSCAAGFGASPSGPSPPRWSTSSGGRWTEPTWGDSGLPRERVASRSGRAST